MPHLHFDDLFRSPVIHTVELRTFDETLGRASLVSRTLTKGFPRDFVRQSSRIAYQQKFLLTLSGFLSTHGVGW